MVLLGWDLPMNHLSKERYRPSWDRRKPDSRTLYLSMIIYPNPCYWLSWSTSSHVDLRTSQENPHGISISRDWGGSTTMSSPLPLRLGILLRKFRRLIKYIVPTSSYLLLILFKEKIFMWIVFILIKLTTFRKTFSFGPVLGSSLGNRRLPGRST